MYDSTNLDLEDFKRLFSKTDLEEDPVPLDVFVGDSFYLGLPPLSGIQTQIIDYMTQIYLEPTLISIHGEERGKEIWESTVNEVIVQAGKGSGKDFSLKIAFARIIYLLHCLKDPLEYYSMGGGEYLDLLNIALNSEQAQRVFFEPLKNLLINSPYFQNKGFNAMSKQVTFMEKPIRAFSGHSEAEGWEGYNLLAVALDEIAAFKVQESIGEESNRFSAKAIYDMSRLSVISRFPSVGKVALLSFPRSVGDFIQRRYEDVIEEKKTKKVKKYLGKTPSGKDVTIEWFEDDIISYREPRVWAIKVPTFLMNPTKRPEDFTSDFIRDPVGSYARLLCVPPQVQEAYFRDPDKVRECFHIHDETCKEKDCVKDPFTEDGRLPDDFRDLDGPLRFVHVDLSQRHDRTAVAMVHCKGWTIAENGEKVPIIRMDLVKYWEASSGKEINFEDIRRFVFMLNDRFRIGKLTQDQWQAYDSIRMYQSKGINAEIMSVKKEHYDTLASSIHDGRFEGYFNEILVEEELLKLQLIRANKVDHPKGNYHNDGADCLAGSSYTCAKLTPYDDKIEIRVLGDRPKPKKKKEEQIEKKPEMMPHDLNEFIKRWKTL